MTGRLVLVAEGHSDVAALPIVVGRVTSRLCLSAHLHREPIRVKRQRLQQEAELRRVLDLAALKATRDGAILIVVDADDDRPCELGPALLGQARRLRADLRIGVVVATPMIEAWVVAGASGLGGVQSLPANLEPPDDVETIRNPKQWLGERMSARGGYSPVVDLPPMARALDLDGARRRSPSFDKCFREVERLLRIEGMAP